MHSNEKAPEGVGANLSEAVRDFLSTLSEEERLMLADYLSISTDDVPGHLGFRDKYPRKYDRLVFAVEEFKEKHQVIPFSQIRSALGKGLTPHQPSSFDLAEAKASEPSGEIFLRYISALPPDQRGLLQVWVDLNHNDTSATVSAFRYHGQDLSLLSASLERLKKELNLSDDRLKTILKIYLKTGSVSNELIAQKVQIAEGIDPRKVATVVTRRGFFYRLLKAIKR